MKTDKIATAAAAKRAEQKAKAKKPAETPMEANSRIAAKVRAKRALETTEAKPDVETNVTKPAKKTPAPAKKAPAKKTAAKKVAAKKEAKPVEHADHITKGGTILELLQRKGGATSAELMQATGWQRHSVRGYISAVVGKKLGLKVTAARNDAGEYSYAVVK